MVETTRAGAVRTGGARTAGGRTEAARRALRRDATWVDAAPFRAHVRHLMSAGSLDVAEVAVVVGLPTRAVQHLLDGRSGRTTRRINRPTARRLLLVRAEDVRELRWCVTPPGAARLARDRLLAAGWSVDALATAAGSGVDELAALDTRARCSRLLAVRLLGLARMLPGTRDDDDLLPLPAAA